MTDGNIEHKTWFNNKQVLSLLGFAIFATYFTTQYILTSDDNDERLDDVEALHEADIEDLEDDMKEGFRFLQDQRLSDMEEAKRRTNTIRDRTDSRLERLEESNSDKN